MIQIKQNLGKKTGLEIVVPKTKFPRSPNHSPIDDFRSPEERRKRRKYQTTSEKEHNPNRDTSSLTLSRPPAKLPSIQAPSLKKTAIEQPQEQPPQQPLFTRKANSKYPPHHRKDSDHSSGNERRRLVSFVNRESSDNNSDTEEQSPFTDHTHRLHQRTRFYFKPTLDLKQQPQTHQTIKLNPLIPGLIKSLHRRQVSDPHQPALSSPQQNKSIGSNQSKFDSLIRATFKPTLMGKTILNMKLVAAAGKSRPLLTIKQTHSSKQPGSPLSIKACQGLSLTEANQRLLPTQTGSHSISAKEATSPALLSHKNPPDNSSILEAHDVSFNLPYFQANYRKKKQKILNLNTSITLKQAAELEGFGPASRQREQSLGYRFA